MPGFGTYRRLGLWVVITAMACGVRGTRATDDSGAISLSASPSGAVRGKKVQVSITPTDKGSCTALNKALEKEPKGSLVVAPLDGSGVHLTNSNVATPCLVIADLSIDEDAPAQTIYLVVQKQLEGKEAKTVPLARAEFLVKAFEAGPIPPGLQPMVDVLWGVVPQKIAHDNFGHWVADKFYCIEVVIGNNSGYPLQIASVGFEIDKLNHRMPTNGYHIVRASIEDGQIVGARPLVLGIIGGVGVLMTGFTPFYHNLNRKSNYQSLTNLVSSPLEEAVRATWPDSTIKELNRLDDQVLRDGIVVPNNTQVRTLVFVAKSEVLPYVSKASAAKKNDNSDKGYNSDTECAKTRRRGCEIKVSVNQISSALGKLVLIGNEVFYLNRVRVEANPPQGAAPPSNLEMHYKDQSNKDTTPPAPPATGATSTIVPIAITGKNLDGAELTAPDGSKVHVTESQLSKDHSEIDAKVELDSDVQPGSYPLTVRTPAGSDVVTFKVAQPPTPPPAPAEQPKPAKPVQKNDGNSTPQPPKTGSSN